MIYVWKCEKCRGEAEVVRDKLADMEDAPTADEYRGPCLDGGHEWRRVPAPIGGFRRGNGWEGSKGNW